MLSFDIGSLQSRAAQVDGRLPADDPVWEEGDSRPADSVHVTGRLSSAGADNFYFSGQIEGTVSGECRRCLTDVQSHVAADVHFLYSEMSEESDDPDMYPVNDRAGTIDLRPAVREHWMLEVPSFLQCRDDCKGLCPTCGADLNAGSCNCEPVTDSRWAALRKK
jgi:uncharacterized protein